MRSPVLTSMSYSRGGWVVLTVLARWMSSSVVLPMALTTATTSEPCRRVRAMWSATARIRSASPTEVPPNFCTTSGIPPRLQTAQRLHPRVRSGAAPVAQRSAALPAPSHARPDRPGPLRGDRRRSRGLGRVCARAQREESPPARRAGGPSGRRGPAAQTPAADPQRRHRRGGGRGHRGHRLRRLGREQARGVPVQHELDHHDGRARGQRQLQAQANEVAVKAGCPPSTKTTVNDQKYSAAPAMTIDTSKTYTATVKTTTGTFDIALDAQERAPDREQLRVPGRQGLLQLRDLPPGHPGVHGPDRRPDRARARAVRATPSPTRYPPKASNPSAQYPLGSVAMANTGPASHRRQPVLHRGGTRRRVPAQHLHAVRNRHVGYERGGHHQQAGLASQATASRPTSPSASCPITINES